MSRCKLEEFISYEQPAKYIVDSDQYDDSYETPVLTAGKSFILGYTDEKNNIFDNLPVIIFDDFTTSVQFVDFPFKVKSSAMKLLKNTEQADIKYCYYLLKFLQHTPENHKRQWLSATSQNTVELPTIEDQKNIVKKLDKILEVIDNQNKQLELLDEAIKARFVEMFGDEKKQIIMRDVCSIITDGTHQPPDFKNIGIPFIFVSNIAGDKLTYNVEKYIDQDTYDELIKRTPIEVGDVLLSTVGSYGHAAVVKENKKFLFQRHIAYLKPKSELINSDYLHGAILSPNVQEQIERAIKGIAQKTLNLSEVKKLVIPLPSMEKQNQFASFVQEVDKSRSRIQKSLEASQELFDSLMQEYFG